MHASALCAVQLGANWQIRLCSRTLLGWRLGEHRVVKGRTARELFSSLSSRERRGILALAVNRENLLVRFHGETDSAADLFPTGEELIFWRREAVTDGARGLETIGLRRDDAENLHREAQRVGFSRSVLFPAWVGSIAGFRCVKTGGFLEFDEGLVKRMGNGWSDWRRGTGSNPRSPDSLPSGVEAALSGGLVFAIENSVPSGWSTTTPARRRGLRWLPSLGLVMALMVAFAGRWNWLGKEIAVERASLQQLRSIHKAQSMPSGCSMSKLMEMLQRTSSAARRDVTATTVDYSVSDGVHIAGVGSSPSDIRSFIDATGLEETTISFTARDSDIFFQVEAPFSCDD